MDFRRLRRNEICEELRGYEITRLKGEVQRIWMKAKSWSLNYFQEPQWTRATESSPFNRSDYPLKVEKVKSLSVSLIRTYEPVPWMSPTAPWEYGRIQGRGPIWSTKEKMELFLMAPRSPNGIKRKRNLTTTSISLIDKDIWTFLLSFFIESSTPTPPLSEFRSRYFITSAEVRRTHEIPLTRFEYGFLKFFEPLKDNDFRSHSNSSQILWSFMFGVVRRLWNSETGPEDNKEIKIHEKDVKIRQFSLFI